jgi:hypothetical protein
MMLFTWSISLTATAQQQTTTTTTTAGGGTGATTTPSLTPLTPPLTPQEQEQQIRLQDVIASTTLNLQETQKQISGVVFTPRWSNPVWVNANSVAVLVAYCLPGEFADSGQEILGGFELEILESYAVALPQGFMVWMAVVGNEDIENRRFPAALGVICASDLNKPETRVLSPQKQQEINKINEQFVNIQNTQITDIDNIINVINTVTTTTTTTTAIPPPTTPQNLTGGGAGATTPAAAPVQDTTPPVISPPENIVVEATTEQGTAVVRYTVTAQDDIDGTATLDENNILTQDNDSAVYANVGGGAPPMSGAGGGGNVGTMTPPINCCLPGTNNQPAVGGDITITSNPPSGSTFPIGTTTVVEIEAIDSAGNEKVTELNLVCNVALLGVQKDVECGLSDIQEPSSSSPPPQPVTRSNQTDTTPPSLSEQSYTVEADSEEGIEAFYSAVASDNVDGVATLQPDGSITQDNVGGPISISCDPPSGSFLPLGKNTGTCTAADSAGNVGGRPFTITVTPPSEDEGETAQVVQEEEPPSPAEGGEEQGEGETTDAEALLPPPAGEEQQPPASEGEGEGGEEENEGEPSEE